jgi:hypothetical protein
MAPPANAINDRAIVHFAAASRDEKKLGQAEGSHPYLRYRVVHW